jgi:4-coumarate--CoA ligase
MPFRSKHSLPIPDISLPSLLFTSPSEPLSDKPSLIDARNPAKYLTHHTYRLYSQRLAAGLLANGLSPGDRVLLYSGNNIYFPVVFMGVIMAGAIFTGANPGYNARELAYQLQDSDSKFLFCSTASLDNGLKAAAQIGLPKHRIFVFDDELEAHGAVQARSGCQHWTALLADVTEGQNYTWRPCKTPDESNETIALNYSSGTTGLPKGVEITHKNYVANTLQQKMFFPQPSESDNWLCFLPLFHAMGQTAFVAAATLMKIPVYIMQKFDFVEMLDNVQKYRITFLFVVPPILVAMAKNPDIRAGRWDLSSVKSVGSGAAPLGSAIVEQFSEIWRGNVRITQGWGMTEVTCAALGWDPGATYGASTVGGLLPNCEAKIMNDEGTAEVPKGERGEIWVRAPNVMKGYWRNKKATMETLTPDGWLKTGDICFVDEHGLFYIVDRKKVRCTHNVTM